MKPLRGFEGIESNAVSIDMDALRARIQRNEQQSPK